MTFFTRNRLLPLKRCLGQTRQLTTTKKVQVAQLSPLSTSADETYVPVIDLAGLRRGDPAAKAVVTRQIRDACENVGFFIITSHGVPQAVINTAWRSCVSYFDLPAHVKGDQTFAMNDSYPYGYSGLGEEILSKGKDFEKGQVTVSAPDLKESFQCGPFDVRSGMVATRWPSQPPGFEKALVAYYMEMEKLAAVLLECFAMALDLPEGWFRDKVDRHCSALRVLNYPDLSHDPQPGQLRASSHTDYGIMTILKQDDAPGGLQVMKRSGEWVEVPHLPDAYVINLGDLMQRWTNELWVSTPHRVVCPPRNKYGKSRRQSMAYFFNINADQTVTCIETCVSPERPPKYPPINAMDFLLSKHEASQKK